MRPIALGLPAFSLRPNDYVQAVSSQKLSVFLGLVAQVFILVLPGYLAGQLLRLQSIRLLRRYST